MMKTKLTTSITAIPAKTTISSTVYTTLNTTASIASTTTDPALSKSTVIGAIIGVVIVTSAVIILLYYFTKYRKNRFTFCRNLKRRTWSTGSNYSQHNPLEPDETGTSDPPPRTERQLFSISDQPDDDGYLYDEIFDASEFTDEKTKRSIKNLYTATRTHEDVPDLNLRI
ncbi:unnamed protein product [Mytilus coruscus]|uniref:Uncharacterized protein n=1 Tax=Mytilus coruscus TaxID=42192 RepID=A0A6J8CGA6_MYTCO|nr:unnamed protein product [Mytilus coruscus]